METINEIDIDKILLNPEQPRKVFNEDRLQELAESIKENGLINPIQVKKSGDNYILVCGERRFKAHKILGLPKIKAIIKEYKEKKDEMIESLIENLHRDNLNSKEKEDFISDLWNTGKYKTITELAKALGYSNGSSIRKNLAAKNIREITNASNKITTRVISDTDNLKNIEDKKIIFNKIEKKEILPNEVRELSKIIAKSQPEVKKAIIKNEISIKQAKALSDIPEQKIREKIIKAHKEIKKIDEGIENSVIKKRNCTKKGQDIIKINENLALFRVLVVASEKEIQKAIKCLIKCSSYINLMDNKQIEKLKHNQSLFNSALSNALILSEDIQENLIDNNT